MFTLSKTNINTNTIEYFYDTNGIKLKKTVTDNNASPVTVVTTHYIDGFQYNGNTMDFFPTAEGYVKATHTSGGGIGGGGISFNYVYYYTDHLGNIRLRYAINPVNQWLEILEEDHYYPFGLKHQGYNAENYVFASLGDGPVQLIPTNPNVLETYKYKYNGKELQDESGLNFYDFGFRNYQPDLGRWSNMDALSELYHPISPYGYALNNPMFFVDPDGNYIEIYYREGNKEKSERYEYQENRDYSEMSGFKADAYMALDALYEASNIEVDGEQVNVLQTLMGSDKELSIVKGGEQGGSHFAYAREYQGNGITKSFSSKVIGTIYFNNEEGVLFDDVNDTNSVDLSTMLQSGNLPNTAKTNSPTSVLGHETVHAFNYLTNKTAYKDRRRSGPVDVGGVKFKNQEEARTTTLSKQININLKENPRNNHNGIGIPTQSVISNKRKD